MVFATMSPCWLTHSLLPEGKTQNKGRVAKRALFPIEQSMRIGGTG
jgi:hypothetical protein